MTDASDRDRMVLRLYDQLLEIEHRLIPTGMHVFGRAPDPRAAASMLRMVASFDRPERGIRALPDLVAAAAGLPDYRTLLAESAASETRLRQREQVESLVAGSIERYLASSGEEAVAWLASEASAPPEESAKVFAFLDSLRERLATNHELDSLVRALRVEYIAAGPGADIVQNPDILPTGRNIHAVNPYSVPSHTAVRAGREMAEALLQRHLRSRGRYPEAIGMVLWGLDNIKTQGEGVAQALWLMGVEPRRDTMNRAVDVEVIPSGVLARPRIDVVMSVSGIFRDLFGTTVELLDRAARKVAALDEPDELNFVRKHAREQMAAGGSDRDCATRVFSNAAGVYGTNVNHLVIDGRWEEPEQIGDLFITRKCFAYGRGLEGREARELMDRALSRVELTFQNLDNTEIGLVDVDHYFEYLGGLTRAVQKRSGVRPDVYVADSLAPLARIRSLEETVRLETRTKTLNPKWYEGMLKHGYSGVAAIEHRVANTFGWSATADAVDGWVYEEIARTYVFDESMLDRLRSLNPHAALSLAGRLLEAEARGFWDAGEAAAGRLRGLCADLEDQLEGVRGSG